ncbi:MAG TPA: transporter [Verrucomicrobiae bacterium]|nr:transporter [Verrucomicrobiae bacterium]
MKKDFSSVVKIGGGLLAVVLTPGVVHACACGCGIFDVATSSMIPNGAGIMSWLQYAYMDQNQNWRGLEPGSADNNPDKEIQTQFITAGVQYMFNQSWGAQVEIPYDFRYFKGTDNAGNVTSHSWNQLGDIRLEGIYTFANQSAGVTFGVKLPTGTYDEDSSANVNNPGGLVDRDTQIGTGSTDILLGGYYRGNLTRDGQWGWFEQSLFDAPALVQADYRPGFELDSAGGIVYKGASLGRALVLPIGQLIFSERTHDAGAQANSANSGYQRLLISPAVEVHAHPFAVYADIEVPVLQNFKGNQLSASVLYKFSVSCMF